MIDSLALELGAEASVCGEESDNVPIFGVVVVVLGDSSGMRSELQLSKVMHW